jgi:hypothetical protein
VLVFDFSKIEVSPKNITLSFLVKTAPKKCWRKRNMEDDLF